MTHRKDVIAFESGELLQEVVEGMLEEGYSRYPVYEDNLDNMIGVIHYKDTLKFYTKNPWAKFKPLKELPGLIREAILIPETRSIGTLFRYMQSKKIHMAIVLDEYGQTAGIVSMEDIIEEIVGDIMDEYDDEEAGFRLLDGGSMVIDGLTRLEDVEDKLGISFGDVMFETLNGYLTSLLGHIPAGEDIDRELEACGYRFKILSLGNKVVGKVRAQKAGNPN
jgi:putative hemolysin